jgi:hypothetical protein
MIILFIQQMSITKIYKLPTPTFALGWISITFNSNLTNGGKNANGYGIIGSGVAVGSGGINPSINTLGLLSTFNSTFLKIVKELLRVWIEKL